MTETPDDGTDQAAEASSGSVEEPPFGLPKAVEAPDDARNATEPQTSPDAIAVPKQDSGQSDSEADAPRKRVIRIKKKRGPVELKFQPVENGVDYLLSVTEHLADKPSPRNLKYAILHLQAATEVLLKARLQLEHWTLVFEKLENASLDKFNKGDFQSCGTPDALKRLKDIVGIEVGVTGSIDNDLRQLVKWRNALQHYGLTVPAPAVEKLSVNVLDFLLSFVRDQLRPELKRQERQVLDREMESVSDGLASINRFLTARMNRLADELKDLADEITHCPLCMQKTLIVDGDPDCRFCQVAWRDGGDVAAAYVENVQGLSIFEAIKDGGDALITNCPECQHESLVADVQMASGTVADYFCFQCGTPQGPLGKCDACGSPTVVDDGLSLCGFCLDAKIERF
ncbi:zinc ribbon domain-containing protein [Streptomyces pini]|uniref:Uncharacterized protein n=1 Tax=Streptomyces pini TaxID=1520580 RepID=A0A1I3YUA8_9ACTN|nr:zinc ribbon domain-containing protein [Streptomyces pini]SFK34831.1 hypothetical protein SAMN05192584_105185 [Streptomyces pini]